MLKLSLLFTNVVNTSSSYDGDRSASFRIEHVQAKADSKNITFDISYYLDTRMSTEIILDVNDMQIKEVLSPTKSKHSLRSIKLKLPNNEENTRLDFKFASSWSQSFDLDGTFYFDNLTSEKIILDEKGDYNYKVIKGIKFMNKTKKFQYNYDIIKFKFIPEILNKVPLYEKLFLMENNKKQYQYKLFKNNKIIEFSKSNDSIPSDNAKTAGQYKLEVNYKYRNGGINKKIIISYNFLVEKNLIGDCKTSYYCLIKGEIDGHLKNITKENLVL